MIRFNIGTRAKRIGRRANFGHELSFDFFTHILFALQIQ